jgi:PEP-CTERM motif
MTLMSSLLKPVALAALLATASVSHAAITVVTSLAAFNAATATPGTDTFAGFSIVMQTPSPITRTAGPYGYTATSSPGRFFGGGTTADPFLSTESAESTIIFNAFSAGVRGIGGNFFASNISGLFAPGDVTLTATDASGTVTQTIAGATMSSFLGFVSDGPITQVTLASVQPAAGFLWPSADNLVLASAVPEPGTYALMLAGLGVCGFMARRRRV